MLNFLRDVGHQKRELKRMRGDRPSVSMGSKMCSGNTVTRETLLQTEDGRC